MPQVSLYIDNETMQKIEKAASRENVSISKWVGKSLKKVFKDDYADNYFDLKFSLENIFKRSVDLLEEKAIKNPYFKKVVEEKKQLIYG